MRHLSNILPVLLVAAIIPFTLKASPVEELTEKLSPVSTLKGTYSQRTIDASGRIVEESGGEIILKKPNMFRISTRWPFSQLLMSDGESFWSYDAELEQVIIREFTESFDEMPVLLLTGEPGRIDEAFEVATFRDEDNTYFVLTPRDTGSVFETLTIEFGSELHADTQLKAVSIFDSLGQTSRIEFDQLEINPPIDGFTFDDEILERADVIDERSDEPL